MYIKSRVIFFCQNFVYRSSIRVERDFYYRNIGDFTQGRSYDIVVSSLLALVRVIEKSVEQSVNRIKRLSRRQSVV